MRLARIIRRTGFQVSGMSQDSSRQQTDKVGYQINGSVITREIYMAPTFYFRMHDRVVFGEEWKGFLGKACNLQAGCRQRSFDLLIHTVALHRVIEPLCKFGNH